MAEQQTQRVFGLDLLRTIAILIVVLEHSLPLVSDHFEVLNHLALPDGVDLFFVLSGFLIGSQLIQLLAGQSGFSRTQLFSFFKRRWWRTLPNYYLFLLINLVLVHFSLIKGELNSYAFSYAVFLQNVLKPVDFLFWESWSLAVEEWFYLLFPLLLFVLLNSGPKIATAKNKWLFAILLFITLPLLYRLFSVLNSSVWLDWDLYYRKLVATRLDAMGFGLLAAFVHHYYRHHWIRYQNSCFALGCVGLMVLTTCFDRMQAEGFFLRTVYFSSSALFVATLLPKLSSWSKEPIPLKPFSFISRISYSMYLMHLPLYQLTENHFTIHNSTEALLRYSVYWITVILLPALIYRYFEKPLMYHNKTKNTVPLSFNHS